MPDVLARVETVRAGDRIFTPRGRPDGYPVERVESYDDGSYVVVYKRPTFGLARWGAPEAIGVYELGLRPLAKGERLRVRRCDDAAA